jgi:hypothetical protein
MSVDLEKRVEALERQVARLQQRQSSKMPAGREWLDDHTLSTTEAHARRQNPTRANYLTPKIISIVN